MSRSPSVILIEFNELTPDLVQRFIDRNRLPNFRRFYQESEIYTTDAEEEGDLLEPWIQWVTLHTGLSAAEHGVQLLSESPKCDAPAVWDLLSDAGYRVWICGSMNAFYRTPLNGYVLPDPWSTQVAPHPRGEFEAFYRFVQKNVQEHTTAAGSLTKSDALNFLRYMVSHGLAPRTVVALLQQILSERGGRNRWRRAVLLDRLQWDVFHHYYRRLRPEFATFFLNSTAHFQHKYWRNMEPELFNAQQNAPQQSELRDAILFGYERMDDLLGRFMTLAGSDTTLIFCTALSQQPYRKDEASGGRRYYHLKRPTAMAEKLGVEGRYSYEPVMAQQFYLRFESEAAAGTAHKRLETFRLNGRQVFELIPKGSALFCSCALHEALSPDALLHGGDGTEPVRFFDVFYEMDGIKSGYHHPDGMLWVRRPDRQHQIVREKISLRSVAPAVLEMFGLPAPEHLSQSSFLSEPGRGELASV